MYDCFFIEGQTILMYSTDYNGYPSSSQLFGIFGIDAIISEQVLDLVHTAQGSELDPLELTGVGKQVYCLCRCYHGTLEGDITEARVGEPSIQGEATSSQEQLLHIEVFKQGKALFSSQGECWGLELPSDNQNMVGGLHSQMEGNVQCIGHNVEIRSVTKMLEHLSDSSSRVEDYVIPIAYIRGCFLPYPFLLLFPSP